MGVFVCEYLRLLSWMEEDDDDDGGGGWPGWAGWAAAVLAKRRELIVKGDMINDNYCGRKR